MNQPSSSSNIKAIIFSAGLGTRFKPWTNHHPKALAVVNGKSLLQRNIEYLQSAGIFDVVVNVHHFADQIIDAIEKNNGWGSRVEISDESDAVLETGGGLLKARKYLQDSRFVTINVDILTDTSLGKIILSHEERKALVTLAVTKRNTSRYLLFNEQERLCGWRNRSTGEERISMGADVLIEKAFSGLAVFEPAIFDLIDFTGKFSIIEVYLSLAAVHPIYGFDHTGSKLLDVGKPESVALAESIFT